MGLFFTALGCQKVMSVFLLTGIWKSYLTMGYASDLQTTEVPRDWIFISHVNELLHETSRA